MIIGRMIFALVILVCKLGHCIVSAFRTKKPDFCQFTFYKLGIEPNELNSALTDKIESLIKKCNHGNKSILPDCYRTPMYFAMKPVVQNMSIRPRLGKPDLLDRRRASLDTYTYVIERYCTQANKAGAKKKGVKLPDSHDVQTALRDAASPKFLAREIYGKPGLQSFSNTAKYQYHEQQKSLLKSLSKLLRLEYRDDKDLDAKKFSSILDYYTVNLLIFCSSKKRIEKDEVIELGKCCEQCEAVVMLRIVNDCLKKNDLMKDKGWETWRGHLFVMISFLAMLVALLVAMSVCKYKSSFPMPPKCFEDDDTLSFLERIYSTYDV